MKARRLLGMLVCVAAGASTAAGARSADLQDGWIYVERQGIDSTMGAYHDKLSGLFVETEIASERVVIPWARSKARVSGAEVSKTITTAGEKWVVHLPAQKEGCTRHVVSWLQQGESWNLSAVICSSDARGRFEALVGALGASSRWPDGNEIRQQQLTREALAKIRPGMNWPEARHQIGPSANADGLEGGGFKVEYEIEGGWVTIFFDINQHVVKTELPPQ